MSSTSLSATAVVADDKTLQTSATLPQINVNNGLATPSKVGPGSMQPKGPFSYVTLGWLTPMMLRGYKKPLEDEDLLTLQPANRAQSATRLLDTFWKDLDAYLKKRGPRPSLFRVIVNQYLAIWFLSFFIALMTATIATILPLFQQAIINKIQYGTTKSFPIQSGPALAFTTFGLTLISVMCNSISGQLIRNLVIKVRALLVGAVFEKSMRASDAGLKTFGEGRIMQLINTDVEYVVSIARVLHLGIITPIQVVFIIFSLVELLGKYIYGTAAVLAAAFVTLPLLLRFVIKYQILYQRYGDDRLKLLREIFQSIKFIKLRGIENIFQDLVRVVRTKQVRAIAFMIVFICGFVFLMLSVPITMPLPSILLYGRNQNGILDPAVLFPAIAYFSLLYFPLQDIPNVLTAIARGVVSWKRLMAFLLVEEVDEAVNLGPNQPIAISLKDASFAWSKVKDQNEKDQDKDQTASDSNSSEKKNVKDTALIEANGDDVVLTPVGSDSVNEDGDVIHLKDLNLDIRRGELTAIVGVVGSGKSSLLSAIVGHMSRKSGEVQVNGTTALCLQQSWLMSQTVRENILFGNPEDPTKLESTIKVCGIDTDLKQFERGLDTEIGDNGITLSGGQRARVALARAVYDNADIYLLDDPLSALDAHVSRFVYENCIRGALDGKTRVLVTHQLYVLPKVDRIVVLDHGKIVEQGTFEELMKVEEGHLAKMMKEYQFESSKKDKKDGDGTGSGDDSKTFVPEDVTKGDKKDKKDLEKKDFADRGLVELEDRARGSVKFDVVKTYYKFGGGSATIFALALATLLQLGTQVVARIWLTFWTDDKIGLTFDGYFTWYVALCSVEALSIWLIFVICVISSLIASKKFHDTAMARLLRAPMSYFDSQPVGRILNRLTSDISEIDAVISNEFFNFYAIGVYVLVELTVLTYATYYVLILYAIMFVIYSYVLKLYRSNMRELKRLTSMRKSPLNAFISECLGGLPTIRAFKAYSRTMKKQQDLIDSYQQAAFLQNCAYVWLQMRVEIFSSLLTLLIALVGIYSTSTRASTIGLALEVTNDLNGFLNLFIGYIASLEAGLVSVERLKAYCFDLPQEAPDNLPGDPESKQWPRYGEIEIKDLEVRYASKEEPVLKGVSVRIQGGEKLGIVGRTGSGKSTLLTALFRLVEPSNGSVVIDGVDVSTIGLHTLRTGLQIIPQDPVLFSGTLRSNIDPTNIRTDAEIWDSLTLVGLKSHVSEDPKGLEAPILVMDEASSAVDAAADNLIIESIRTHFKNATVISIAHRLNTVAGFDKVLVLDAGRVVEHGSPAELLRKDGGVFRGLVQATGKENMALIEKVALQHEEEVQAAVVVVN
ncbi:hypothetical protein HDU76_012497 [Blyttiomyces sp. JEL0837]|nr:hypothetical protein HDU76_012497 [Blyttiomyces sp. JEL0837]